MQTSGKGRQNKEEEMADFHKIVDDFFLYSVPLLPEMNPEGNAGEAEACTRIHSTAI